MGGNPCPTGSLKKSKMPLITQLLIYFPAFSPSNGSADTLVSLQGTI